MSLHGGVLQLAKSFSFCWVSSLVNFASILDTSLQEFWLVSHFGWMLRSALFLGFSSGSRSAFSYAMCVDSVTFSVIGGKPASRFSTSIGVLLTHPVTILAAVLDGFHFLNICG